MKMVQPGMTPDVELNIQTLQVHMVSAIEYLNFMPFLRLTLRKLFFLVLDVMMMRHF